MSHRNTMEEAALFSEVLRQEHEQLLARRTKLGGLLSDPPSGVIRLSDNKRGRDPTLDSRVGEAHADRPFGLCLSGGGIRSATFNLGILQGLTERGLLPFLDYLSTVSGGGYIGCWLHGVIKHKCQGDPNQARDPISPTTQGPASKAAPKRPGEAARDPITFLRKYSNYLAPKLGLFSPDFWVIVVIWIRNMLLNQLILAPFLAGIVLLGIHAGFLQQWLGRLQDQLLAWIVGGFAAAIFLLVPIVIIAGNLYEIEQRESEQPAGAAIGKRFERFWLVWLSVGGVLAASLLLGSSHLDPLPQGLAEVFTLDAGFAARLVIFLFLLALLGVAQGFGGFRQRFQRRHDKHPNNWWLHLVWMPAVSAAGTAALLFSVLHWISTWSGAGQAAWKTIAYGPPLVVLVLLAGSALQIGLMGADFPDASREWLARFAALIFISSVAWVALFSIGVFGPWWISELALRYGKTAAGLAGTWLATTAAGVLSGKNGRTSGTGNFDHASVALEWISKIAPTVFMIGYLLAISFGVHEIIAHNLELYTGPQAAVESPLRATVDFSSPAAPATGSSTLHIEVASGDTLPSWLAWLRPIHDQYWRAYDIPQPGAWSPALVSLAACGALAFLLPLRININEFSLHHFYRNRLARCYLGAGRANDRRPNPFTGFDTHDDFPIAELRAVPPPELPKASPYLGPYAIVNTTLNLNSGSELATQERKGASFIFTPLFSGFDPPHSAEDDAEAELQKDLKKGGYCETRHYMYPVSTADKNPSIGGPAIGTAMGISGAAANPNDGFHTSGAMAFLLTVFDVRLGWWAGNPRRTGPSRRAGPRYALGSLLSELFAQTNERSHYLNLSDGGHFENLGLYELIKRRCRYIIACDAEEDAHYVFESLGAAIRKCRADFGVEIDLDPTRIHPKDGAGLTHCVVGTITYPEVVNGEVPEPVKGWILYLKASLTGDEPDDVKQYHAGHSVFPQEPTADQFFTESQFESYRRLGLHVVESTFENVSGQLRNLQTNKSHAALGKLFQGLCQQWYPPSTIAEGVATRHAEAYAALMQRLSKDNDLRYLDRQIIPQLGKTCNDPPPQPEGTPAWVTVEIARKAQLYCLDLIQLMENVWTDLHLYNRADRDNPKNSGWMRMFRYWVAQPVFKKTWEEASCTYSDLFRQFFEEL